MSPRKLTEDDKQEILQLYRNSEATTSTLATRYEVSSSTISRFLKNKLSSAEYEDLIQQKRLARTPRGEKTSAKKEKTTEAKKKKTGKKSPPTTKPVETETVETTAVAPDIESPQPTIAQTLGESQSIPTRRRRRRSSTSPEPAVPLEAKTSDLEAQEEALEEKPPVKLGVEGKTSKSNSLILKSDRPDLEEEEDDDEVNIITLKEMLGEDLEDINDDEDEEDEDWEDEEEAIAYPSRGSRYSDVEIRPLSQATFPRTCYLVIDRSAELIVKPLADFADLGEIPQDEIRQRTLPVFDNHRIAKRFSHRRERVIKVPDGRMLQKTSRYLQDKGITRLLIDGQIYSLPS